MTNSKENNKPNNVGKVIEPEVVGGDKAALRFDIEGDFELTGSENDVMWILKDQAKKHFFSYYGNPGDETVPSMMWFEDHYIYVTSFQEFMNDMDLLKEVGKEHIRKNNIEECVFMCEVEEEEDEGKIKHDLLTVSYMNKKVFGTFCFKINLVEGRRELEKYEAERLFYQCEQYLNFFSTYDKNKEEQQ